MQPQGGGSKRGLLAMLSRGRGGGSGKADALGDGCESGKGGNGSFRAGAGADDNDSKDDPSNGGNVRSEARMRTKEALRAHLKTSQPKRSILKKSETQLDAAAEGDEEALLRIAKSMAASPSGIATALFTSSGKVTPIRVDSGRLDASSNDATGYSRANPHRESGSSTSADSEDDDDAYSQSSNNKAAGGRQMPGSPGGVRSNVGRAYSLGHETGGPRSSCPGSPVCGSPGQQRSGSPLQRGDSSPRLGSGTLATPTAVQSAYGGPVIVTTPTSRLANSTDSKTLPSTIMAGGSSRLAATHGTAGAVANRLSYNGAPRTPPPRAMSLAGTATGSYGMDTLHEEYGSGNAVPALVLPQRILRRPDSERPGNGGWAGASGSGGGGGASAPLPAWQTDELGSGRPASPGAVQIFGGGVRSPRVGAGSPNPDMMRLVSATESVGAAAAAVAAAAAAAAVDSPKGRGARSQLTAATREDIMRSLPPGACVGGGGGGGAGGGGGGGKGGGRVG